MPDENIFGVNLFLAVRCTMLEPLRVTQRFSIRLPTQTLNRPCLRSLRAPFIRLGFSQALVALALDSISEKTFLADNAHVDQSAMRARGQEFLAQAC